MIIISFFDSQWKVLFPDIRAITKSIVKEVLKDHGYKKYNIEIIYANDVLLHQLNNDYRGKNKSTNVLSFPHINHGIRDEIDNLGEIFISFERIECEAKEKGIIFYNHFVHLLIHGVLHLLGYTHARRKDRGIMESKETSILNNMGIDNPYDN